MKNLITPSFWLQFVLLLTLFFICQNAYAQLPPVQWQHRYGGVYSDAFKALSQTKDGGFIAVGAKTIPGVSGSYNYWIVKTDSLGILQWEKTYGGSIQDYATTVQQTKDGGYIVGGDALSANGDVTGKHGDTDAWILKLDAIGNVVWKKCYGGSAAEHCNKILQLKDGTYMVAGSAISLDGDLTGLGTISMSHGMPDVWLFRLDTVGNIIWNKTYGGFNEDVAKDICELSGNEFVVAGYTSSNNVDVSGNHGQIDSWIFRIDSSGNIIWQHCLGGSKNDIANKIIQTQDSNFVAVGYTMSSDGDITGFHGGDYDTWAVKLDGAGNLLWQKALGGSGLDWGESITQQADGALVIASDSRSADGDVSHALGSDDIWLSVLDNSGNLLWEHSYGGSAEDGYSWAAWLGIDIIATRDNGIAFAGMTGSPEVPGGINSSWDGYLVKLKSLPCDTLVTVHDTGVCAVHPFTLLLHVLPATTCTWNDGSQAMDINVHDTGTYWCNGITGCNMRIDTFHIHHAISINTVVHDTLACRNMPLILSADAGFDTYAWNTGTDLQQLQVTSAGVYYCIATDACRLQTDTFTVHYKDALPIPDLGPDRELCSDTDPQIGVSYPDVNYLWNTGDTTFSIHLVSSGRYIVTITNSCEAAQDSVFVKITDCNDCLFIPSAFTPNNDGRNDELGAIAKCNISSFQMNIYDRWGQLVFITYNINTKWDGRYKGTPLPVGAYYYTALSQASDGRTINSKGDITLIR